VANSAPDKVEPVIQMALVRSRCRWLVVAREKRPMHVTP